MRKFYIAILAVLLAFCITACSDEVLDGGQIFDQYYGQVDSGQDFGQDASDASDSGISVIVINDAEIPEWNGVESYYIVNNNMPYFDEFDKSRTDPFENYSDLDDLGRCGVAYANICRDLMPTEKRGEIGSVKPSGWHTVRYNGVVNGNYLYNRCHLIGYQLAGENANNKNLITGTRYLNIDGMLDFENLIADYVKETGFHVLYRVTPVFLDSDLISRGVLMEGWSVEDAGEGICFNAFAYNNQPGIEIDYATGDSWLSGDDLHKSNNLHELNNSDNSNDLVMEYDFVVNSSSGKFHLDDCKYAESMNQDNRVEIFDNIANMLDAGYSPCGVCHPDEIG